MIFDSLALLFSVASLLAVAVATWSLAAAFRPSVRLNLRFAAALFAAAAVASPFGRIGAFAMLVALPPAVTALALAALARFAERAPPLAAAVALTVALASALGAALVGAPMLAAVPAAIAACVIGGAALQDFAWVAALSALALLACVFAFVQEGAGSGALLFAAAALLGFSRSALSIEQPRDAWLVAAIGVSRQRGRAIGHHLAQ
jgi:hypothetical protein